LTLEQTNGILYRACVPSGCCREWMMKIEQEAIHEVAPLQKQVLQRIVAAQMKSLNAIQRMFDRVAADTGLQVNAGNAPPQSEEDRG